MTGSNQPSPGNDGPRRAGIEGRKQKRFECRDKKLVRFAVRPTFQNFNALVHDVSANGVGFLIDRPLELGTTLALQLKGGRSGTSLVRTAKVVHVRRHLPVSDAPWVKKKPLFQVLLSFLGGGGSAEQIAGADNFIWLIGCRLSPPLSPEELEGLCGSAD